MKLLDAFSADGTGVMTPRTLANSHPCLLPLLRTGTSVLDVGCGPGTLTAEIAKRVHPGSVVGMDCNLEMIRGAEERNRPGVLPNLIFYTGDIRESGWDGEFDVANAARALQWIARPQIAIARMARAARSGGHVVALDYDHTRARWVDPPSAWTRFHEAYLYWRRARGLDNAIARRLPRLFERAGLVDVRATGQITTVQAGAPDFFRVAGSCRMIIESHGRRMVGDGLVTEGERREALDDFTEWMKDPDAGQTVYESCVIGRRP